MARSEIILGTPPQGLGGDPPRVASMKINAMTDELYRLMGGKVDLAAVTNADVGSLYNTAGWFLSPTGNSNNPPLAFPFGILHCPSQTSHAFQIASPVTSVAANRTRLWIRQRAGTTWSPWSEILTGAGTAATLDAQVNVDDETVGRLQLVGSMGWGSINRTPVTSLNDFTASQKFNINADVPGNPRQLSGLQFAAGSCGIAMCWTAAHQQQLVFSRTTGQIVYRYKNANVWQPDQHLVLFPAGQTFLSVAQGGNGNASGISDQAQTALNTKADKTAISNVNNTSDLNKPISTATQTALNTKFDAASAILDPQSAGGLMSYTSNATGEVWKFLSGLMITSQIYSSPGDMTQVATVRYKEFLGSFPAAFSKAPKIQVTIADTQPASRGAWISNANSGSGTSWQVYASAVSNSISTAPLSLNILAVGTWK